MTETDHCGLTGRQRIGEPQLDERLTAYTDSLGFPVYGMQQVNGEIDVHTLNFTPRTSGVRKIQMSRKVFSGIVHFIQTSCGQRSSLRDSALLLPPARGGPR